MAQADTSPASVERPLSPHLQIYATRINMAMSIIHRMTGIVLYLGTIILVWWLVAAATGPDYYAFVSGLLDTLLGRVVLIGYTWALLHHMFGGIRHFIWDTGAGFSLGMVDFLCWISLIGSLGLTAAIWFIFGL